MLGRSRLEWFSGGTGMVGIVSGLLSMALMVGLVFFLAVSIDPDAKLSTASAPVADAGSSTGASTGEGGSQ